MGLENEADCRVGEGVEDVGGASEEVVAEVGSGVVEVVVVASEIVEVEVVWVVVEVAVVDGVVVDVDDVVDDVEVEGTDNTEVEVDDDDEGEVVSMVEEIVDENVKDVDMVEEGVEMVEEGVEMVVEDVEDERDGRIVGGESIMEGEIVVEDMSVGTKQSRHVPSLPLLLMIIVPDPVPHDVQLVHLDNGDIVSHDKSLNAHGKSGLQHRTLMSTHHKISRCLVPVSPRPSLPMSSRLSPSLSGHPSRNPLSFCHIF